MGRAAAVLLIVILIAFTTAPAAAQTPTAELLERDVHNNFLEEFEVMVRNPGTEQITVIRVSVIIDWPGWAPTLYPVFEGRSVLAPGEEMVFKGPSVRMPNTDPGTYPAFAAVVTETPQGHVEERFPTSVSISDWDLSWGGIPEFILIPLAFAGAMLLITSIVLLFMRNKDRRTGKMHRRQ